MIGRLKPGVSAGQAQIQVDHIAADLRQHFPIKQTAGLYFHVVPMFDDLVGDVRPTIVSLMGAVAFVLLIACANVANLLVVRASARSRELAVRAAIGASRGQLVRQMLAESLVIAACGTGARPDPRARRHPGAAGARPKGSAATRRGRDGSRGARLRGIGRRGDGDRLRTDPGAARLSRRRDGGAALGRRALGRAARRPHAAQRRRRHRGGAVVHPAGRRRVDAAERAGAGPGQSRLRPEQRPDLRAAIAFASSRKSARSSTGRSGSVCSRSPVSAARPPSRRCRSTVR